MELTIVLFRLHSHLCVIITRWSVAFSKHKALIYVLRANMLIDSSCKWSRSPFGDT